MELGIIIIHVQLNQICDKHFQLESEDDMVLGLSLTNKPVMKFFNS